MPHLCNEPHLWWVVGIVIRKFQLRFEVPALQKVNDLHEDFEASFPIAYLIQSISWPFKNDVPHEDVVVVLQSDRGSEITTRHTSCYIY